MNFSGATEPSTTQLLEPFLMQCINWSGTHTSLDELDPHVRAYVEDWGKEGDHALIAWEDDQPVGAAWVRYLPHGYGYIADDVPELAVAVIPEFQSRGIATKLISKLHSKLYDEGIESVSLSVNHANPAAALFAQLGYITAGVNGDSSLMIAST